MAKPWNVSIPRELRGELPVVRHYKEHAHAAAIALFHEDRLLLVQGKRSGQWQLPAGRVDESDAHIWETATREFYEEMGSTAPLPAFTFKGWFETNIQLAAGRLHNVAICVLQTGVGDLPFMPNNETRDCKFVPWAELSDLTFRYPNDETIPLIYDYAQPMENGPGRLKAGPWASSRPKLECGIDGPFNHEGATTLPDTQATLPQPSSTSESSKVPEASE